MHVPGRKVNVFPSPASYPISPARQITHCSLGLGCQPPCQPTGNSTMVRALASEIWVANIGDAGGAKSTVDNSRLKLESTRVTPSSSVKSRRKVQVGMGLSRGIMLKTPIRSNNRKRYRLALTLQAEYFRNQFELPRFDRWFALFVEPPAHPQ